MTSMQQMTGRVGEWEWGSGEWGSGGVESGGVGEWETGEGGVGLESRPRQLNKEYFPHTQLEKSPLFHFIYTY